MVLMVIGVLPGHKGRIGHHDHTHFIGQIPPPRWPLASDSPGVYAGGHRRLTQNGFFIAAVLAAGPGAVLSHRSAAALWGMRRTSRAAIDVTAPRRCRRAGIEAHRAELSPDEVTVHDGIPVTNPARTLFDLAAVVTAQQLEHALNQAEIRRLASPVSLAALIARHPRRKGTQALRRALEIQRQQGETVIRSDFETAFLDFAERYGLPQPTMDEPLGPYEPDAFRPDQRVVVELDSYAIHTRRQAFESDRARDRELTLGGYRVVRITWRQSRRNRTPWPTSSARSSLRIHIHAEARTARRALARHRLHRRVDRRHRRPPL